MHHDTTSHSDPDVTWMRHALSLAEKGWGQTAPNPMVGAVVVSNGVNVGEGYHKSYGEAHAEVNALAQAGDKARGASIYVTLEPCNHHGLTPPCTDAIIDAGISRVVFAARDPNPVAGGAAKRLQQKGIQVMEGVCEAEAKELNAGFFASFVLDRPWITLKLGISIDGAIADAWHESKWITNELSRAEVQRLRCNVDAIGVGAVTALRDHPSLLPRVETKPRKTPIRVVFDRQNRISSVGAVVRDLQAGPVVIVNDGDTYQGLRTLKVDHGIRSMLVEGGAGLAGELLKSNFVDRLVIFQAPLILGQGSLNAFSCVPQIGVESARRYPVVKREVLGDDVMSVYAINSL